jgi:hypothetical protein
MQETGPNKTGRFLPTNTTSSHWFPFIRGGRVEGGGEGRARKGTDHASHLNIPGNVDVKMKLTETVFSNF